MAGISRQLVLAWSLPALAVLVSLVWLKRLRQQKDPGGKSKPSSNTSTDLDLTLASDAKSDSILPLPCDDTQSELVTSTPCKVAVVQEEICSVAQVTESDTSVTVEDKVEKVEEAVADCLDEAEIIPQEPLLTQDTIDTEGAVGLTQQEPNMAGDVEKRELVDKLASLELDTMKLDGENEEGAGAGKGRDSANHSPSEVMLASPSISTFSDAHSEGSSDSGKGHSDIATSPSRTPAGGSSLAGDPAPSLYEFVIPQLIVGKLIGRHGHFLREVMTSSHTNIFIKRHPESSKLKVCAIEGSPQDIDKALAMIRKKFPLRRYSNLTLERVTFVNVDPTPSFRPEDFNLHLEEGVNNDVIVSSLVSAGHLFVQLPSHPSYLNLTKLHQLMSATYASPDVPALGPPATDVVCAAPSLEGWYRAQVVGVSEDGAHCDIKFLDYGGYLAVDPAALRQIRCDFLMLPFQAIEVCLANVAPVDAEAGWSEEAKLLVQALTYGRLVQAQVYGYAPDGTPLVYLYGTDGSQMVLVNEELVLRGLAVAVIPEEEPNAESAPAPAPTPMPCS